MSWRRKMIEGALGRWAAKTRQFPLPEKPRSIFVLRNNDIGDLLVVTPLFEALKKRFPDSQIIAGIGTWNLALLENNPWVDRVLEINAPWHNKQICHSPHNSLRGLFKSLKYIFSSPEVERLKNLSCAIGIDVLGSPEGSLLMLKAKIPYRLGVKGYAGGHSAVQQYVEFNSREHVGRSALRFAELLGATNLPPNRPQIFLTDSEKENGRQRWQSSPAKRIVIGPGGGFIEKCWPHASFVELIQLLKSLPLEIIIVGGKQDSKTGDELKSANPAIKNLAGQLSLRETFAVVAASDLVICNSSMLMHTAAAFSKKHFVLLGDSFPSATDHHRQWGYENLSFVLGKEKNQDMITTAQEAFEMIRSEFSKNPSPV